MNMRKKYEEDGYLIIENVLSKTKVSEMKQEIKDIFDSKEIQSPIKVDGSSLKRQGVFIGVHRSSERIKDFVKNNRILLILNEIFAGEIYFTDDKVVVKNATTQFASPWHQDWGYMKGAHKVSVWLALDDTNIENGCLKVLPGSHKKKLDHEETDGDGFNKYVNINNIDEKLVQNLPVKAGAAIILDDLILHASFPNLSGEERWAYIMTYTDGRSIIRNYLGIN